LKCRLFDYLLNATLFFFVRIGFVEFRTKEGAECCLASAPEELVLEGRYVMLVIVIITMLIIAIIFIIFSLGPTIRNTGYKALLRGVL
jgi:hypothetical protein